MTNTKQLQAFFLNFIIIEILFTWLILPSLSSLIPLTNIVSIIAFGVISGICSWALFWIVSIARGLIGK